MDVGFSVLFLQWHYLHRALAPKGQGYFSVTWFSGSTTFVGVAMLGAGSSKCLQEDALDGGC